MQGGNGPPGANIFVFHVPINWTDDDFNAHFSPFGQIVQAKIHVDPVTKASKGFGFCSYATTQAATMAIKGMNGFDTTLRSLSGDVPCLRRSISSRSTSSSTSNSAHCPGSAKGAGG
mmetsp:Transcript_8045/g.8880  ORF Transcript_8045/g.8880 Transcript_8045/m.8880 type:complete len:117 (+) Transcript_8045:55-405(+)